jgi:hypothetical protein
MVGPPPFTPGTSRALIRVLGPHVVVCHRCRKFVAVPALDVPYEPCPFVCKDCGTRGEIKDRAEAPADYAEVTRTAASFVSPKNRWKATR